MDGAKSSRRRFLFGISSGLGSAWLNSRWPLILAAQEHAHQAGRSSPSKFEFFSPLQAAEIEAMAAQIIPADETPGAREARTIYFIDRALTTFDRDKRTAYAQ